MPPETNNEPHTQNDAAQENKHVKKRPKDHSRRYWRHSCAPLPRGSEVDAASDASCRAAPATREAPSAALPLTLSATLPTWPTAVLAMMAGYDR